jgi:hypothetical protein
MRSEMVYFGEAGEVYVPDGLTVDELIALAAAATSKATALQRVTEAERPPTHREGWVRIQGYGDFIGPGPA